MALIEVMVAEIQADREFAKTLGKLVAQANLSGGDEITQNITIHCRNTGDLTQIAQVETSEPDIGLQA